MTRWKPTLYRTARWLFFIASVAYLVLFAREAMRQSQQLIPDLMRASLVETAVAAGAFMLAALLSVVGWRALLQHLSGRTLAPRATLQVFCTTQIAKYLPGNVGHHIGRVTLAHSQLGMPAATTTLSILQEGALVVSAALVVGTACFFVTPPALPLTPVPPQWLLVGLLVGGFGTLALVNRFREAPGTRLPGWMAWPLRVAPAWLAVRATLPAYVAIQVLNGIAVTCIASATTVIDASGFALLTGAYSLAWMLGFLLPGAPGGLGVRESTFLVLIADAWPPEVAFGIAILSRVANVVADALIFLVGMLLAAHVPPEGNS